MRVRTSRSELRESFRRDRREHRPSQSKAGSPFGVEVLAKFQPRLATTMARQRTLPANVTFWSYFGSSIRFKALVSRRQPPAPRRAPDCNGPARKSPCGAVVSRLSPSACVTLDADTWGCRRRLGGPLSARVLRAVFIFMVTRTRTPAPRPLTCASVRPCVSRRSTPGAFVLLCAATACKSAQRVFETSCRQAGLANGRIATAPA